MFEWLFKYSLQRYADGEIAFQSGRTAVLWVIAVILLAAFVFAAYRWSKLYSSNRVRAVSLALRLTALGLLFVPLFEPVLVSPDVVDDENFVAVVVDVSESMSIRDGSRGLTRLEDAKRLLFDSDSGIIADLDEHFQLRYYTFDSRATRVDSIASAAATGSGTDVSGALERVLNDFRGIPLSGIVLVTDGGDNSTNVPLNKAEELAAADAPLFVVGVGRESFEAEREILEVDVNKAVEQNTGAEIEIKVRSWAKENAPVTFSIKQGNEVVFTEKRTLKGEGRIDQLAFFFEPQQSDVGEYTVHIETAPNELNDLNNSLEMLIDTKTDTMRVLYFEGALRQDFKFIKRALEDDQVVNFVSVSRTGTGKYYRQGIRSPDELAGGFPTEKGELYGFKAIVFGDVEASNFTIQQLRMIEEYVRVRGGGFLMLGGLSSFTEGDYWNTPVADILPVNLDLSRRMVLPASFSVDTREPVEQGFKFHPTQAGLESPVLKLSPDARTNSARWSTMPGLTSINLLGSPKAGSTVLAVKPDDGFGASEPLLVTQRYGRGRSTILSTASTWRWQMLLDAEDQRHERFWRQLVRWQVADAPDAVNVNIDSDHPEPGQEIGLDVDLFTSDFRPQEGAEVSGIIRDPFGTETPIDFQEELSRGGTYSTSFAPRDEGIYQISVSATAGGERLGDKRRSFLVRKTRREYYDAALNRQFLENIAATSGGAYFTPDKAAGISDRLRGRRTQTTIYESESIWDSPLLLALIIGLLVFEWYYRRRKGLA